MRICFTGMTTIQVKPPDIRRSVITKIDVPAMIVDALREGGHEVDWRRVAVGEDLSDYDWAFVGLGNCLSMNGRPGALGALWTVQSGLPFVCFLDDWQFRGQFSNLRSLGRHRHYLHKTISGQPFFGNDPDEVITQYEGELLSATETLSQPWPANSPRLMLCPMHTWGDHARVLKDLPVTREQISYVDPSPIVARDTLAAHVEFIGERELAWTLPALMPHGDWLDKQQLSWPVQMFGSRKMGAPRLKTEADVVREIDQRVGLLSPRYHHSGSGWWRSRFLYGALTGAVVAGDPTEGADLEGAFSLTPRDVETLGEPGRADLARRQRDQILKRAWTREEFVTRVNDLPRYLGV